jgi:hypothetical protein
MGLFQAYDSQEGAMLGGSTSRIPEVEPRKALLFMLKLGIRGPKTKPLWKTFGVFYNTLYRLQDLRTETRN